MAKTLTIMLTSDRSENGDPAFAARLTEAVLKKGHKVNIFLYGKGVYLSKKEDPGKGPPHIADRLLRYIESEKTGAQFEKVAGMGATIATCHTNEYARGIEGREYLEGIKGGDIGHTFCDFLLLSHVFLALNH